MSPGKSVWPARSTPLPRGARASSTTAVMIPFSTTTDRPRTGSAPVPSMIRAPLNTRVSELAMDVGVLLEGDRVGMTGHRVGGAGGRVPAGERSGPPESGPPLEERRIRRVGDGAARRQAPPGDRTHPPRAESMPAEGRATQSELDLEPRVERVAEPVAEEVDAEHGDEIGRAHV